MLQHTIMRSLSRVLSSSVYLALVMGFALQAASLPSSDHLNKVNERLDRLKARISITASEEPYWQEYRQSVLDNVTDNESLLHAENSQPSFTAPQYFVARMERVDRLDHHLHIISERFNTLYHHLTASQQAILDGYFEARRRTFNHSLK